jgi:molecular chaperone Hsp33
MMENGSIAKDLAVYHLKSEQVPTAFNLSVKFDPQGVVTGAGGLFLQAMPGADDDTTTRLESLVIKVPSLGDIFSARSDGEDFIVDFFTDFDPKFLARRRVEFMCHCSPERIHNLISMLPPEELKSLCEEGSSPVEIRCHYCNTPYQLERKVIRDIFFQRFPDSAD